MVTYAGIPYVLQIRSIGRQLGGRKRPRYAGVEYHLALDRAELEVAVVDLYRSCAAGAQVRERRVLREGRTAH